MNSQTLLKVFLVVMGMISVGWLTSPTDLTATRATDKDRTLQLSSLSGFPPFQTYVLGETDYNRTLFTARQKLQAGLTAYKNRTYSEAIAALDEAIKLDPSLVTAYEKRALSLVKLGKYSAAKSDLHQAITLDPRNGKLYSYRGSLYMNEQAFLKAITDYGKWIELNPQSAQPYFYRGTAYLRISEGELAIRDFTDALFHQPSNERAYYNRGVMHALLGDLDEAIRDFTRALNLNKYLSEAYLSRALAKTQLNQHNEALQDIEKALAITPSYHAAYLAQGTSFQALGRLSEAHTSLLKAIDIDPLSSEAYYQLATLETLRKNPLVAAEHYQNTLRLLSNEIRNEPMKAQLYSDKARVEVILKDYPAALSNYKKAYAHYQTLGDRLLTRRMQQKMDELKPLIPDSRSTPAQ